MRAQVQRPVRAHDLAAIACPYEQCRTLPGFRNLAKLTFHLVDYHAIAAEQAQAEARAALDGPRPRPAEEDPVMGHPRRVVKVAATPTPTPCGDCHRADGSHTPSCRSRRPGAGAGRQCGRCGKTGHRRDTCPTAPPTSPGRLATRREIQLASGGVVILEATVDLFTLSATDRRFMFGLVDTLDRYQGKNKEKKR